MISDYNRCLYSQQSVNADLALAHIPPAAQHKEIHTASHTPAHRTITHPYPPINPNSRGYSGYYDKPTRNRSASTHHSSTLYPSRHVVLSMDILSVRLAAINPTSRPQLLPIPARPNQAHTIGRNSFSTGDDAIISRQHAQFTINTELGLERLVVTNLSLINGILVNFTPLLAFQWRILHDGDEIVRRTLLAFVDGSVFLEPMD